MINILLAFPPGASLGQSVREGHEKYFIGVNMLLPVVNPPIISYVYLFNLTMQNFRTKLLLFQVEHQRMELANKSLSVQ